jgi:hypothetical protein
MGQIRAPEHPGYTAGDAELFRSLPPGPYADKPIKPNRVACACCRVTLREEPGMRDPGGWTMEGCTIVSKVLCDSCRGKSESQPPEVSTARPWYERPDYAACFWCLYPLHDLTADRDPELVAVLKKVFTKPGLFCGKCQSYRDSGRTEAVRTEPPGEWASVGSRMEFGVSVGYYVLKADPETNTLPADLPLRAGEQITLVLNAARKWDVLSDADTPTATIGG